MTYDRTHWEELWAKTLRENSDKVARRPPNRHLVAEVAGLRPGRALDAGCGHGAETLWLAAHGWQVTAVDFSASALAHAEAMMKSAGAEFADRVTWVEGDLSVWSPAREVFDLVVCLYVHVAGRVEELVRRMAGGVASGGTLFMVGHRPVDPVSGQRTAAADQVQVSVADVTAALDAREWQFIIAEERARPVAGSGVDAVVLAKRLSS
jgi:2-polyprenyl-3-methyl-5-hydroxy-6-metoxy-1,4-benzoquinol methylase